MKILEDQKIQDNTVGSRSKIDYAYIAGFLDGDGSMMLQLKKRKDSKTAIRFMATICFYQDTRHEATLYWIQKILGKGYTSRRNDGMTELRINGYKAVNDIIKILKPYLRFKKIQGEALSEACHMLSSTKFKMLNGEQLVRLVDLVLVIQNENYVTKKKKTRDELLRILGLTP